MAGPLGMILREDHTENVITAISDQWEIQFSRFLGCVSRSSTNPHLVLSSRPSGLWISSSSTSFVRLIHDSSSSDVILIVTLQEKIIEEHYLSKLYFSWPQVSCVAGFPSRGTRTVFVSYRDSSNEIQKFAFRFPSIYESESFMNTLKSETALEMVKDVNDIKPVSSDFGSRISAQSDFASSNRSSDRAYEEFIKTPVRAYTPQPPRSYEVEQHSCTQEKSTTQKLKDQLVAALPPSFTSLLTTCYSEVEPAAAQGSQNSGDTDLKSQIAKYMEDSTFLDMLDKVDKVINEMGGDITF